MSDQTHDPENDPGRDNITLNELMGGTLAVTVLAVLLIGSVVIDMFALDGLMSLRDPQRFFADPCVAGNPGPSGGFALALVAGLGIALLGLHLFSRRNIVFSGVLALGVLVFQVWMIAKATTLKGFLENYVPFYHNITSTKCAGTYLRDEMYFRYKAVEDLTTLTGGIQETFAYMLQFNLLVLFLVAALIWLVGIVAWVFAKLAALLTRRSASTGFGRLTSGALGIPERTILFQTAALTLLAAVAGPVIMLYANNPDAVDGTIRDVIWSIALLFLLDAARWALITADDVAPATEDTQPDVETPELLLAPVVQSLHRQFANNIPVSITLPPSQSHAARDRLSDVKQGEVRIIEETLGERHFDLFARTIDREMLDRGKTALVICPEDSIDNTETLLANLLGSSGQNGTRPRIWRLGQSQRRPEGIVDVILVSEFTIETLASNVENYRQELRLLGGLVAMNLHQIDIGLLDVALDRLTPAIPGPETLVGIFHGEPRHDMANRVGNFAFMPGNKTVATSTTGYETAIPQWAVVLDDSTPTTMDDEASLPIGYRAILSIARHDPRPDMFTYGPSLLYAETNWDNIKGRMLKHETPRLHAKLDDIDQQVLLPKATPHSIALIDDTLNLADSMAATTSTPSALESLKIVTLGAYPMARYLASELDAHVSTATTPQEKRQEMSRFIANFGSTAAKPRQGPRELATRIRMTFRAEAQASGSHGGPSRVPGILKLSQERVAAFLDAKRSRALRQLRINTSRGGLQRLFRSAFRLHPDESVVTVRPADEIEGAGASGRLRIKNFVLSGPPASDDKAVPALNLQFPFSGFHLSLSDHGLSYAEETSISMNGKFVSIDAVDLNNRVVTCSVQATEPLCPYVFVRDYAFQFSDVGRQSFAVEGHFHERSSTQPFEMITGYVDCAGRTYQARKYGTLRTPFGKEDPNAAAITYRPTTILTQASSHVQMRSVTMLRLVAETTESPSASGRTRRVRRGTPQRTQGHTGIAPQTAFTLCMTLQDVLASQFPAYAHRLSVLCPRASDALEDLSDPLEDFVAHRLRHVVDLDENGLPVQRSAAAPASHQVASEFDAFGKQFSKLGREAQGNQDTPADAILTLLLVEDCDHDLGVAQSVFEQRDRILSLWRGFLAHCASNEGTPEQTGYDFGSGRIASHFDFQGALNIVEALCDTRQ